MCNKIFLATLICGTLLLYSTNTAQGSSRHLTGTVNVEGGRSLKNLIVFLEPVGQTTLSHSPKKHKVRQKGRKFLPGLLIVTPGDTIQYLNDEDREIDHNIYSLSQVNTFDLGLGERGTFLEQGFDGLGKVNYFCSVHKLMEGEVIVIPSIYFAHLSQPGNFILPDVPFGKWEVKVFIPHRRFKSEPFQITVGPDPLEALVIKVVKK